jgi:mono/diheme cytochrome c family protein
MFRLKETPISTLGMVAFALSIGFLTVAAVGCGTSSGEIDTSTPTTKVTMAQVQQGRALVVGMGCADCHNGGKTDPSDPNWLSGYHAGTPGQPFQIGPFQTYPANLTPDMTGLGMHTDLQVFNALRYGLDPETTPSVTITSTTPGTGNFPANPHYLAPPMPWTAYRHLTDDQIRAIVAYLKHGIKSVNNAVPASTGPPDFWAGNYVDANVGPANTPNYPASNEEFKP